MSSKSAKPTPYSLLNLATGDLFPCPVPAAPEEHAYQSLLAYVLPNFLTDVRFVLAEILELERAVGRARTILYSSLEEDANEELVSNYFGVIHRLFKGRGWS